MQAQGGWLLGAILEREVLSSQATASPRQTPNNKAAASEATTPHHGRSTEVVKADFPAEVSLKADMK